MRVSISFAASLPWLGRLWQITKTLRRRQQLGRASINEFVVANAIAPAQILDGDAGQKIYIFDQNATFYYTTPTTTNRTSNGSRDLRVRQARATGGQTIPIAQRCT